MNKKMTPLFSFVGSSGSGKTTFLEKLITYLSKKGYKIGAIKHDAHKFEIDKPGKDSYRLKQAGAKEIVIASKDKVAMVKDLKEEMSVYEIILNYFDDVDIIFTEGYKKSDLPKIEIFRVANKKEPVCFDDKTLIGIVTDSDVMIESVKVFGLEEYEKVADFILKEVVMDFGQIEVNCENDMLKTFLEKRITMLSMINGWRKVKINVEIE